MGEQKEKKSGIKKQVNVVTGACIGLAALCFGCMGYVALSGDALAHLRGEGYEISVYMDGSSISHLNQVLSAYAEQNPDAEIITAMEDGSVVETDADTLQCVVTDDTGNIIGVISDRLVLDEDGNVTGVVHEDGRYIDGASGISSDGQPYYHVTWGDTLCKVSSATHYSVQELAKYNHIDNVNMIYAESDLRIPPADWDGFSE